MTLIWLSLILRMNQGTSSALSLVNRLGQLFQIILQKNNRLKLSSGFHLFNRKIKKVGSFMSKEIIAKAQERMNQSHQSLAREFSHIRAGRANASLLDRISVEY